jgi:hypothetical protein
MELRGLSVVELEDAAKALMALGGRLKTGN